MDDAADRPSEPLWEPDPDRVAQTAMDRLRRDIGEATASNLADSRALFDYSLEHPGDFWDVIWGECGVVGDRGDGPAYVLPPAHSDMRSARFFPAATLSLTENLLAGGQRPGAGQYAIVYRREDGVRRTLTWAQLEYQVDQMTAFLRSVGVTIGDRVAAWMPNVPETVIALMATANLGATFTSTSPDFGVAGVLDRFGQVEPKVLIAADGYVYANKRHQRLDRLAAVIEGLDSLVAVIVHGELDEDPDLADVRDRGAAGDSHSQVPVISWSQAAAAGDAALGQSGPIANQLVAFDHPLFILYSSGTTGAPKCIVHRTGGVLLKLLVEHQLHCDIRPGDRVFYFTTCGWMMWNWLTMTLGSGATIVLYDGSPFHPQRDAMWDIVESERVTLFGTSAKYLDAAAKAGATPGRTHDLADLRTICSTGSPLSVDSFEYVYREVKSDVHLASISGGTDLCGCLVMGDPTRPVYAGEIQGPALGVAADVWDPQGISMSGRPNEQGELVCTQAFPSMPLAFWHDPDATKYTAAYFERFSGIWAHGDFASWTEHGGVVIHGRSDATLNSAGVRIGTAEIYGQVEQLPEILEALAIGQRWEGDTRIVLFVRLAEGVTLDDELARRIGACLRENCSPRHVPARVVAVADLPRTRSGKLAELAVTDVVHGRAVRNREALANPESLDLFSDLTVLTE